MDKLKMHSPDLTQDNIARIRELFPGCVTEAENEDGNIRLAVDFDQLRQELSDSLVEGPQERYHLDWPGKRQALLTANAPIAKTLRPYPKESLNFDTTQNLFIEGDNLDALKLLQETYLGKVKMIYIDPPYNTGNDFVYEDDFAENTEEFLKRSNQKNDFGHRLVANLESNGRFHSDWLSMIYPRLKLAKNLLSDNGLIFISIDDNEEPNLRRVCDDVFGPRNFVATYVWKARSGKDHTAQFASVSQEYVLCYCKEKSQVSVGKDIRVRSGGNYCDDRGNYRREQLR
ncbi:MAG: site-specific DNA-methyltransferase, partial [Syntrophaceae bacterium]|nr:site-specific DNA-methyltransferase [Syntrophaceae bacterium]